MIAKMISMIITENKKLKLAFKIFSLLCGLALVICLVCDAAAHRGITWAGYPVASVLFAWVVVSTFLLAKKNKVLCSLVSLTVTILPFLYLMERLAPVKEWFSKLGAPIAITVVISIWLTYCLIRFFRTKMNIWHMVATLVFINGVFLDTVIEYIASAFFGERFFRLSTVMNFFACIVITALLAVIGYYKNVNVKLQNELQNGNGKIACGDGEDEIDEKDETEISSEAP